MDPIQIDDRHQVHVVPGLQPVLLRDSSPVRVSSVLRDLLDRLVDLIQRQGDGSGRVADLRRRISHEIERSSVYAVTLHEDRHFFDGSLVREKLPQWGRTRFLDGKVYHLDLLPPETRDEFRETWEERLVRACKRLAPLHLLGVKARDDAAGGVFLPTGDFERGLSQAFGTKIAAAVLTEDRLDRLQFLTILAHREGQAAKRNVPIQFPTQTEDDPRFDGLLADLDTTNWSGLLDAFQLPVGTQWLQVTVLDKEQGLASKGSIRRCPVDRLPRTYSASWKIGRPAEAIDSSSILIHESDGTYRPRATVNLQMLAFNFTPAEQRSLIDQVFLPSLRGLLDYRWTERLRGVDRLLAAGADLRLEPVCTRVNKLRRKLALEAVHKVEVPGLRAKVAPDPRLAPFCVRVPQGAFSLEQLVDLTRDPSLPLGNSTQRYRVVGFTEGHVLEVGAEPWMTVQGGDFDGDDACVQTSTVSLFPQKVYDQTPVAAFREAKKSWRNGVRDPRSRFEQALRVLERPIGPSDLLARRLMEEGRLDSATRIKLSASIQSAIDSAKHCVKLVDHGIHAESREHAIDAIRRGELRSDAIKQTVYEPLATAALHVAEQDLEPITFDPMPIRLAWAGMAARFSKEALAEPSRLAGLYNARFAQLLQAHGSELDIDKLTDEYVVEGERVADSLRNSSPDLHGSHLGLDELCLTCVELAALRFASLHFAARVARMRTLRLVFASDSPFVRLALDAGQTEWLRRLRRFRERERVNAQQQQEETEHGQEA
ncbi:MAG: hypothetical protein HZB39_12145 [Planctomycetes bacterium]|nr:hypothetical protein [Planctomycetota bacterium]